MTNDMMNKLLLVTVVLTVALTTVLLLRLTMRKLFGAAQAYSLWCLVPLALCAALLPTRALPPVVMQIVPTFSAAVPLHELEQQIIAPRHDNGQALLIIWLAGVLFATLWFYLQHRRFVLALGRLDQRGNLHYSEFGDIGPALVGLWQPRIVVPEDFDSRYAKAEQALIVAHEQAHVRRADVLANLLCAAMQCLFWFHALLHAAARRFRFDQELACDIAVMRQPPDSRRTYADAMLKTHLSGFSTAIACQWHSRHPLKERIMNLNSTMPHTLRRLSGGMLIGCLTLVATYGAWAAQGPDTDGDTYRIKLNISNNLGPDKKIDISSPGMLRENGEANPVLLLKDGQSAEIVQSEGNTRLSYRFTLKRINKSSDNDAEIIMVMRKNNDVYTEPRQVVTLNEPGKMSAKFGGNSILDYEIDYLISKAAPPKPQ